MNEAERCMGCLNLALQNVSLERKKMDTEIETELKSPGSMRKFRAAVETISPPEFKTKALNEWEKSIDGPRKLVEDRFKQLQFGDKPVHVSEPAPAE